MSLILIIAILLRLVATVRVLVLWRRDRDWRLVLLALVLLTMVLIPAEAIARSSGVADDPSFLVVRDGRKLPELLASILAIAFVWSLGGMPSPVSGGHDDLVSPSGATGHKLTGVGMFRRDLPHRIEAERNLRESEARFRTIFEQAAVGVAQLNSVTGVFLRINRRYCEILDMPAEDVLGRAWMELTHPDDLAGDLLNMERLRAGEIRAFAMERRLHRSDGSSVWINLTVSPMWQPGEQPSSHIAIVEDITKRKESERKLAESEMRLRAIFNSEPECVKLVGCRGELLDMNPAGLAMIEADSLQQVANQTIYPLIDREHLTAFREMHQRVLSGESAELEFEIVGLKGTRRWVDTHATPLRDSSGEIVALLSVTRDITEAKRAAEALRESEELFRRLVELAPFGVRRNDLDGRITFANEALGKIFGCTPEQMVGRFIWDFAVDDQARQCMKDRICRQISDPHSDPGSSETKKLTCDNRLIDVTLDWTHDRDRDGNVIGFIVIVTDISARKKSEQERRQHRNMLAHMTRLSTMGELVAGIAHEVKQPLYAITNFATAASVSLRGIPQSGLISEDWLQEMKEWNNGVRNASKRANEIIERLREFARKGEGRRESINIGQLIRDSIDLVAFEARQCQTTVAMELDEGLADVVADRIQCEQVLVNLLHNAYEAVAEFPCPRRVIVRAQRADDFVEIQIADNGPGIPADQPGKLFEAFYTTKSSGMGMGLAISQTIVEAHGGRLWGHSNQCGGATFHFTLPTVMTRQPISEQDA